MRSSGFGTIEAIVATALLAFITTGVASTVVLARRLQTDIATERQATQIAIGALERLRAGGPAVPDNEVPGFLVTGDLTMRNANAHLFEARVRVTWRDREPHSLELTTLITQ